MARKNKSKPEIKQDIQKIQNASRMRGVIRGKIHPFLLELNDSIGFIKVFLQVCATTVDSVYAEQQKKTKIKDLRPRLDEIFTTKDEKQKLEYEKYRRIFEILEDETIYDFNTMVQTLPRAIETYFTQQNDKNPIMNLDIDKILG